MSLTDLTTAGTIIEAGSDTTRNQINVMLAAAAKYPAWVASAQRQLDEVCGDASRLPSFDVSKPTGCGAPLADITGLGSIAIHCRGDQRVA